MRKERKSCACRLAITCVALVLSCARTGLAAERYWDGDLATAGRQYGSGTWSVNTPATNWAASANNGISVWDNNLWSRDQARFENSGSGGTITVDGSINLGNLYCGNASYTFTNGVLNFLGENDVDTRLRVEPSSVTCRVYTAFVSTNSIGWLTTKQFTGTLAFEGGTHFFTFFNASRGNVLINGGAFVTGVGVNATKKLGVAPDTDNEVATFRCNGGSVTNRGNFFIGVDGSVAGGGSRTGLVVAAGTSQIVSTDSGNGILLGGDNGTAGILTLEDSSRVEAQKVQLLFNTKDIRQTGTLNLNGGTLAVNGIERGTPNTPVASNALATVNFNGGTLEARAQNATLIGPNGANLMDVVLLPKGGTFKITGYTNTISVAIRGEGAFRKTGSGMLFLFGANTFTGPTLIQEGMVRAVYTNVLNGTPRIALSSNTLFEIVVNGYTLNTNQWMHGFGRVAGTMTVKAGGVVSGGDTNTTGVLTFVNDLTTEARAGIRCNIDPVTNSVISVLGTFTAAQQVEVSLSGFGDVGARANMNLLQATTLSNPEAVSTWSVTGDLTRKYECKVVVSGTTIKLSMVNRGTMIRIF